MTKDFRSLVATAFLGAANDNFFKNSLVMLIAFKGMQVWGLDHKSVVALAGGIFILPYFLFSGVAGEISDKLDRAIVVRYTKYWELIIMIGAGICFYFEAFDWLLLVLFCMGTQSTFFSPAKYSAIRDLSNKTSFVKANASMEISTFLAILLGTIGGGLAAATNSYTLISSVLVLMAIVGIITSRKITTIKALSPDIKLSLDPVRPSINIVRDSFANRDSLWTILATSWFWFLGASLLALMPVLAKDILYANEAVATAFLACFTIGIGLGSFICEKLSGPKLELGLSVIGLFLASLFIIDIKSAASLVNVTSSELSSFSDFIKQEGSARIFTDLICLSLFMGLFIVPLNAWMQVSCKPELRSRVIACNNIINAIAMVLSAVFIMALHMAKISTLDIFAILGFIGIGVTALLLIAYPRLYYSFKAWRKFKVFANDSESENIDELRKSEFLLLEYQDENTLLKVISNIDPNFYLVVEEDLKEDVAIKRFFKSFKPNFKPENSGLTDKESVQTLVIFKTEEFKSEYSKMPKSSVLN